MEIRNGSIRFSSHENSGPRTLFVDVNFPSSLSQATAIMTGLSATFSPSEGDHHLGNLEVRLDSAVNGSSVRVTATFGLRDWSGNWDDKYEGAVHFAVIGEVELDESYFGAKRIRGRRGRGAGHKIPVFGVLKRGGKVYTQIVKNCSKQALKTIEVEGAEDFA